MYHVFQLENASDQNMNKYNLNLHPNRNKIYIFIRMNSTRKRVSILPDPTNIQNTYSKNNYGRANLVQLNKNMKEGKQVVTVGKANAFLRGIPLTPNNISERRLITQNNARRLTRALTNMKHNKSVKRKRAINAANFNQMMRNANEQRHINLSQNGDKNMKYRKIQMTKHKNHKN